MRKLLPRTLLAGCFMMLGLTAFSDTTYLVLNLRDGTENKFALSEKPKVIPGAENLEIVCPDIQISVGYADVVNYTFYSETNSIEMPGAPTERISVSNRTVAITGLDSSAVVSVFGANGMLLLKEPADGQGSVTIDLNRLNQKIIIINTGKSSYKIVNK